jgi:hypothetical protein
VSEKDQLLKHFAEGFEPAMVLRKVGEDEIRQVALPAGISTSKNRALPLAHKDGRKMMYYAIHPETIEFAQQLVDDRRQVTGYNVSVCCSVGGPDTINGALVSFDNVIADIQAILGWKVAKTDRQHTIEISFSIEGNDRTGLQRNLDQINALTLAISLKNRLGFVISQVNEGATYKGQPFSYKIGQQVKLGCRVFPSDLAAVERISEDADLLRAALALQAIYSAVTDDARLTLAWSAVEDIFGSGPEHMLEKGQLRAVIKALDSVDSLDAATRHKLVNKLSDAGLMAKESRNSRIARNISALLHKDSSEVYEQIKALTRARGKRVHSLSSGELLTDYILFAEQVLWAYIDSRMPGTAPAFKG